jgi:hypothetical protein
MARLPTVGGDDGNWGGVLNEYLRAQHNADGTHETTQTLTDGATINWDLSLGVFTQVTLEGNRTLANPTNLINGCSYILLVKQDAVGNRTLSFGNAYKFPEGIAPTMSTDPNVVDIITFLCDGTSLYGSFQGNFS